MLRRPLTQILALVGFSAATIAPVAAPPLAAAGTVVILSCGDAPAGGVDNAWSYVSDNLVSYEQGPRVCPPNGVPVGNDLSHAQIPGISAWTRLGAPSLTAGQVSELRFTAPPGTTVTRVQIKRDIGTRSDGYTPYGRTDAGQLETCTIPIDQFTCNVGVYGATGRDMPSLNAAWVAWGFQCGANGFGTCSAGSTLHEAWAYIYASKVTLTDNQAPTVPTVEGALTTAGWKGGTVAATATGTDNLGVRKTRWYVDGTAVATSPDLACDFTTPVPCSNLAAATTSLNMTALAEGTRSVQLAIVDPAGNETKSAAFNVDVDNTAPAAPIGLAVTGGGASPNFALTWTNPANSGAPLASSGWRACPQGGGPCVTGNGTLSGASGTVPAGGTYDVAVWLIDSAGNGTQANSASGVLTYNAPLPSGGGGGGGGGGGSGRPTPPEIPADPGVPNPPTPPAPPPPPAHPAAPIPTLKLEAATISAKTGTLTVRGRISGRAAGRVTITYRARVGGKWRTRTFTAGIRRGRYTAILRLAAPWRTAGRATITVRYRGSRTLAAATATRRVTRRR